MALLLVLVCFNLILVAATGRPTSLPQSPQLPNIWNRIDCLPGYWGEDPHLVDCQAVIDMIPAGHFEVEPGDRLSRVPAIDLHIPNKKRSRSFILPAAFHSGTCLITVRADRQENTVPHPAPFANAASKMYSTVWPNVRRQAKRIVQECLVEEPPKAGDCVAGEVLTRSQLGNTWFSYLVNLRPAPRKGFPGDGWKIGILEPYVGFDSILELFYNVYEPGGTSSGVGTKGTVSHSEWGHVDADW
ncbi:hypothetical protein MMC30_003523 [Trapelia coarctata]|nr:hypothetical protein [Trapelia coarctata]